MPKVKWLSHVLLWQNMNQHEVDNKAQLKVLIDLRATPKSIEPKDVKGLNGLNRCSEK
ncbi:hypothetical protein [Paraglaciecola sp.]|uniref:hypothetical protein n=1 Tax=Paraglaciecola sp. TaxID=1920173 RepID=UPI003EF76602